MKKTNTPAPKIKVYLESRPVNVPFYNRLGQPTMPRYVRGSRNKYNGDGTLKK